MALERPFLFINTVTGFLLPIVEVLKLFHALKNITTSTYVEYYLKLKYIKFDPSHKVCNLLPPKFETP